jgi:hypothetical protein
MRYLLMVLILATVSLFAGAREELLEEVRGLVATDPRVEEMRDQLLALTNELLEQGVVERIGSDAEYRPLFVTLQGSIEQTLASAFLLKKINHLHGAIHTPTPATPCCTTGEITVGLVDASLLNDPRRLHTIQTRAETVRDYLEAGGKLWVAYPASGWNLRTSVQQKIYRELCENFSNLVDYPLQLESLDEHLIGATYLFSDEKEELLFSIQAFQAIAPAEEGRWRLWLGPISDERMKNRMDEIAQVVPFKE